MRSFISVLLIIAAFSSRAEQGLVAHYTFDEGSGTTAADFSGFNRTGMLQNGTTWVPGIAGTAIHFDGINQFMTANIGTVSIPWSVAMWVNREDSPANHVRLTDGQNMSLRLEQFSNLKKVGITQYGSYDHAFTYECPVGQWTHLVWVCTSTGTSVYANGVVVDSTTRKVNLQIAQISHASSGQMKGSLDDFRVYNRELSKAEISLFLPPLPPVASNDSFVARADSPTVYPTPGVLQNDSDPNSDSLTVKSSTPAQHGTVTVNPNGGFTYQPEAGYEGIDSFSYIATDGTFDSQAATVTINVGSKPLPAGPIKNMLHLGNQGDRITGFPTSAQSIQWDFFQFAGKGPDWNQQPSPGQAANMQLATNTGTTLTWTELTSANGTFSVGSGDNFVTYYAVYIKAPSTRQATIYCSHNDEARIWMDGNSTPLLDVGGSGNVTSSPFTLSEGFHSFIFKLHNASGGDSLSITFRNTDTTDMSDLSYSVFDLNPPGIESTLPANAATDVPTWSEVTVIFNEAMDTSIAADSIVAIAGGVVPPGSWAWTDNRTLTYTPTGWWNAGVTYTLTVGTAAQDLTGNTFPAALQATFTVTSNLSSPALTDIGISNGNNGSVVANVPVNGSGFIKGGVIHPAHARYFDGHYYTFSAYQTTHWHNAVTLCGAQGGHLVTLSNLQEDTFVYQFGAFTNAWIGCSDEQVHGQYKWITGEPMTYTHWAAGEPSGGGEDYGVFWWGFTWNDVPTDSNTRRPYVCEFETQPIPTVSLIRNGKPPVMGTNVRWVSAGQLLCDFDLTTAAYGLWDVLLTNPDGQTALLSAAFTVQPAAFQAQPQSVTTHFNTAKPITLVVQNPSQVELSYSYSQPQHGSISGSGENITYTPDGIFTGQDSFIFIVGGNDGESSATVTVNLTDLAPTASSASLEFKAPGSLNISLAASDPDGDALQYTVLTPSHGTLNGTAPSLTYTPNAGYSGADSFQFRVSDGALQSAIATIDINILNAPPVANAQDLSTPSPLPLDILLTASDADGDTLAYTVGAPEHGSLTGDAPTLTYMPNAAFTGIDNFTFSVFDGVVSASAIVTITVTQTPPIFASGITATPNPPKPGESVFFSSPATDAQTLAYLWDFGDGANSNAESPTHVYAVSGMYSVSVTVSDLAGASATQTLTIFVTLPPTARFTTSNVVGFVAYPLVFDATPSSDPENSELTYSWNFGDGSTAAHKIISKIYDAAGRYAVTLTVTDSAGAISTASREMEILPTADVNTFEGRLAYTVKWTTLKPNTDTMAVIARVYIGEEQLAAGSPVAFSIAGSSFTGTLDKKLGSKTNKSAVWQLKAGSKKQKPGQIDVSLKIKKASFAAGFAEAGAVPNSQNIADVVIPCSMTIGAHSYEVTVPGHFVFGKGATKAAGSGKTQ